jgi:uncharacterized protein
VYPYPQITENENKPSRTSAFDGQGQWWKYLLVIFASFVGGQMIGSIPLVVAVVVATVKNGGQMAENPLDLTALGIDLNLGLAMMMLPFVVSLVIMYLMIKALHKRTLAQTINGTLKIRWKRFVGGFAAWAVLMFAYLLVGYYTDSDNYVFNLQWGRFVVLVVISLLLIPIQTAYEELLFRGYLPQWLAGMTRNRWFPLLISSAGFALMHLANPEVAAHGFWLTMPHYFIFGLMFGLASVLDDGIEVAMGAHAANNIFLSLFITNASSALQTPAMFVQQRVEPLYELVVLAICAVAFIVFMGWRYKWTLGLLFVKVTLPIANAVDAESARNETNV